MLKKFLSSTLAKCRDFGKMSCLCLQHRQIIHLSARVVIFQPKIKLKLSPTKPKFALTDFNNFSSKLQMTLFYSIMAMASLKKTINIKIYFL